MEDPSGDLGRAPVVTSTSQAGKARRCWTVLLIDDLGKTVSFRVSRPLRFALTACLTAILTVVIYLAVSFILVLSENTALRNDLDSRTAELVRSKADREKALVQLMLLQESAEQTAEKPGLASDQEPKDVAPDAVRTSPGVDRSPPVEGSEEPIPAAAAARLTRPGKDKMSAPHPGAVISVKDLEIWREPGDNALRFQFVVRNTNRESGRIAGYTFVILTPDEGSNAVPLRAFPYTRLKDGKPSNFSSGQYFSIARYKFVRGTLTGVNLINQYKTATIYAYSMTGDLLTDSVFEVGKVFRSQE